MTKKEAAAAQALLAAVADRAQAASEWIATVIDPSSHDEAELLSIRGIAEGLGGLEEKVRELPNADEPADELGKGDHDLGRRKKA